MRISGDKVVPKLPGREIALSEYGVMMNLVEEFSLFLFFIMQIHCQYHVINYYKNFLIYICNNSLYLKWK